MDWTERTNNIGTPSLNFLLYQMPLKPLKSQLRLAKYPTESSKTIKH
ncbi:hypothetical protein SynROS8604_03625 [Synechococcus sp. ROS8604]|nr:hypothetical protein SynROS8604_03625 [Synechococcus sp. ROS8604]